MASRTGTRVEDALDIFTNLTNKPEVFLSVNNDVATKLQELTKSVYDVTKTIEDVQEGEALPELLLAGFDDEQVWQELELQNSAAIDSLLLGVSQLSTAPALSFKAGLQSASVEDQIVEDDYDEEEDIEDEEEEERETMEQSDEEEDLPLGAGINFGGESSGDESEEEKELKRLLDKAAEADKEAEKGSEESDDDEDDGSLFGDNFELGKKSKAKKGKENQPSEPPKVEKKRKTVVDDQFFKLADLESFLDREDAKEDRKRRLEEKGEESDDDDSSEDEEDIDVFADIPSEDEEQSARLIRYKDFFDPPDGGRKSGKKSQHEDKIIGAEEEDEVQSDEEEGEEDEEEEENSAEEMSEGEGQEKPVKKRNLLGDDSDDDDDDGKKKSTFEQRQERLAKKIKNLEEVNLSDKPWQLVGEVGGGARPENSLLQEDLDFEQQTRLAPEITEETTKSLEDIIIQRIKDQAWDDVERKVKPVDAPFEYKKKIVLDQEKSKKSLGEIYEEEYLKQAEKDKEEKEDPQHEDIRKSMQSLFIQLDALANFHYTPKPAAAEVKVISNLPTVTVEEVAPVSVSQADMLAPEEIKEKQRKEVKGDTEKTKEDKKADRRAKKTQKRIRLRERAKRQKLVEKLNPGLGNKYAKEKAMQDLEKQSKGTRSAVTVIKEGKGSKNSDLTSSSKFFNQLQDRVSSRISETKTSKKKKKRESQNSSAKLKL